MELVKTWEGFEIYEAINPYIVDFGSGVPVSTWFYVKVKDKWIGRNNARFTLYTTKTDSEEDLSIALPCATMSDAHALILSYIARSFDKNWNKEYHYPSVDDAQKDLYEAVRVKKNISEEDFYNKSDKDEKKERKWKYLKPFKK